MEGSTKKLEGQRWLEVAERLLMARDLIGSKKFAVRAQESDPILDGVDQILAVADVLLSAEKRINNHMDWYAILQIDQNRSDDFELIKRQFKKFALLLHPDKNRSPFADNAFKLVSDAWSVLSDPSKKSLYDNELNLFLKFDPVSLNNHPQSTPPPPPPPPHQPQQDTPVRRSSREKRKPGKGTEEQQPITQPISQPRNETQSRVPTRSQTRTATKMTSFWTTCPYCYNLYEYPRVYEDCCLRCQNCRRAFHAAVIPTPPPVVPGQEAYYCCWAFFPLGFQVPSLVAGQKTGYPNWTPFSAMNPVNSQPPPPFQNPNLGFPDKDNGGGGGGDDQNENDNGNDSDGSWDQTETGSRKKGKNVETLSRTPVIKKTARKSVAPRSTRVTSNEPFQQDGSGLFNNQNNTPKPTKKAVVKTQAKRQGKFASESEIVDLNEDVRGDYDDPNSVSGVQEATTGTEDPIAGIGFFEGLDEILGNLGNFPILSVPGDQNKAAGNA